MLDNTYMDINSIHHINAIFIQFTVDFLNTTLVCFQYSEIWLGTGQVNKNVSRTQQYNSEVCSLGLTLLKLGCCFAMLIGTALCTI